MFTLWPLCKTLWLIYNYTGKKGGKMKVDNTFGDLANLKAIFFYFVDAHSNFYHLKGEHQERKFENQWIWFT